jgi:hypothetical protein
LSCEASGLQPEKFGARRLVVRFLRREGELLRSFLWRWCDFLVARKVRLVANAGIGWITGRRWGADRLRVLRDRGDGRVLQSSGHVWSVALRAGAGSATTLSVKRRSS